MGKRKRKRDGKEKEKIEKEKRKGKRERKREEEMGEWDLEDGSSGQISDEDENEGRRTPTVVEVAVRKAMEEGPAAIVIDSLSRSKKIRKG